jgi:hypothetical protein
MTTPLILHNLYDRDEVLAQLVPRTSYLELCDGEFIAAPGIILAFFSHGNRSGTIVETPTDIIWRPKRLDYAPGEEYPFLPRLARDVSDSSDHKHHLFLRHPGETRFFYLGLAHLGSYGGPRIDPTAHFMLDHKLSMPLWLAFGGYPEWQVSTHGNSHHLCATELHRFQEILADAFSASHIHITLTRYQQDSLQCFTNSTRAWFMYLRTPEDSGLYILDSSGSHEEEHFVCDCGISLEFPQYNTVDHGTANRILSDFFFSGVLPGWITWTDEG